MALTMDQKMEILKQFREKEQALQEESLSSNVTVNPSLQQESSFGMRIVTAICLFLAVFFLKTEYPKEEHPVLDYIYSQITYDCTFDFIDKIPYNLEINDYFKDDRKEEP